MTGNRMAMPLALIAVLGSGLPAAAEMVCGTRDSIVTELERRYGETRRSVGLSQSRGIVEVWASDATGSWTILVTNTAGRTCLMAAGEAFQAEKITRADTPA